MNVSPKTRIWYLEELEAIRIGGTEPEPTPYLRRRGGVLEQAWRWQTERGIILEWRDIEEVSFDVPTFDEFDDR